MDTPIKKTKHFITKINSYNLPCAGCIVSDVIKNEDNIFTI